MLSSFKVPTVWLLVDSDDTIPRGPTGKVDVRRLRELLADADQRAARLGRIDDPVFGEVVDQRSRTGGKVV